MNEQQQQQEVNKVFSQVRFIVYKVVSIAS